ncbi:putative l-ornithine n5-oxygenase [Phaeomoniella chlamydospora]|uniref:L-ornithine N(5)-monooxygenase n=1 Tax=Phaeomoniella chlamydospora TaxID=158046 RepID=A0A0G2F374_PHACM|nr:putative l-ornithine n5-oxygenase [Phaeomoniella chlamydospora]
MAPYLDHDAAAPVNAYNFQNNQRATLPSQIEGPATDDVLDLLCVGFGPASLAIAIALRERFEDLDGPKPSVAFLEKQSQFAWHAGMLLPGSRMQISFIKDLATLRNPKSEFTFLNYLHKHDRLIQFTNLNTFLPSRIEFEDYMRWCADHFSDHVTYGQEVIDIKSGLQVKGRAQTFSVSSRNLVTNQVEVRHARNVVIAIGGKPRIPAPFPKEHPKVIHSSAYVKRVHEALPDREKPYRIAVVGNGQSGAEIFNDLHSRFPNSKTYLIIKDTALRPSDDSPFVNEVFNPERVEPFFQKPASIRTRELLADKATNYGVVRLELLERMYGTLYQQRIMSDNEDDWQHRILPCRITSQMDILSEKGPLRLKLQDSETAVSREELEVDAVFVATGYLRNGHEEMMEPLKDLISSPVQSDTTWHVRRDYSVALDESKVDEHAGIWLQGCNQETHGLADSLLSILAIRGGEMVDSMFGH